MARMTIGVVDNVGQPGTVEVVVRRDTVDWWAYDRCQAVFDGDLLQAWLADPKGFCEVDSVALVRTPHGYFMSIDTTVPWTVLTVDDLNQLWQLLAGANRPGSART